jgi:hypothetical protein
MVQKFRLTRAALCRLVHAALSNLWQIFGRNYQATRPAAHDLPRAPLPCSSLGFMRHEVRHARFRVPARGRVAHVCPAPELNLRSPARRYGAWWYACLERDEVAPRSPRECNGALPWCVFFARSSDEAQKLGNRRSACGGCVWCGDGSIHLPSGLGVCWRRLPASRSAGWVVEPGLGCGEWHAGRGDVWL